MPDGGAAAPVVTTPENGLEQPAEAKPPGKLEVYEQYLRVPDCIVYNRYSQQLRYLKLDGGRYQEQSPSPENPLLWLTDLEIGLGIWQGVFEEASSYWLRWCDQEGNWLLTDTEQTQAQLLQAAQNLLATGMEMSQVAEILGLSETQIQAIRQTS